MTSLVQDVAGAGDDESIRALLRSTPVPGAVTLTYEQEPSFFHGAAVLGSFHEVIIGRDAQDGAVRALGVRSIRGRYVNGDKQPVGYLSHLRIDTAHQGRWLLGRGFRALREMHEDGRCEGYITTIIEGNQIAEGVLVDRARPRGPVYREVCRITTLAIPVLRAFPRRRGYSVRPADGTDLQEVVAFLSQQNRLRQFAPTWSLEDFQEGSDTTRGLRIEDIWMVHAGDELVAVGALWNQSGFKQSVVREYSPTLGRLRPYINAVARRAGGRSLPSVGHALSSAYAALVAVADDNLTAYRVLLDHLLAAARRQGLGLLIVGHAHNDPLLRAAKGIPHLSYGSRLYTVGWDSVFHERLDGRPVHVEVACL